MTTITILLLLVAAASTIAFLPPAKYYSGARRRRDVASGSQSGSGAVSFASSSSSSSGSGPGYSTSISSRSGIPDSGQGLNSVNPGGYGYTGAGDFNFPNYGNPYQGGAGYVPVDFHNMFMQYLDFMQRMAQQQAYAPNGNGQLRPVSSYISWAADGTSASPSIPTTSVAFSPYYQSASAQYYDRPVSSAQYYSAPSTNYYTTPTLTPQYYSTPISTSKYFYNTDTSKSQYYNNPAFTSQHFNTPSSTYKYYNTPTSTVQYYGTPSSTVKYIGTPNSISKHINTSKISTRQLLPASNTLSTSGQPALQHYSRSSASVSFNGGDISSRSGYYGGDNFGFPQNGFAFPEPSAYGGNSGDGQVSASASANLSPRGGFGSVSISPPPQGNPELATRMGSVPPSGAGGNFAVFTSSSSGSSDDNGVKKSFKEATSVINDNGKVTTYHVRDP